MEMLRLIYTKMRRRKCKHLVWSLVLLHLLVTFLYFSGINNYLFTQNFDNEFDYPLNVNTKRLVNEIMAGNKPSVLPINYYPYKFLTNSGTCDTIEKIDLFIAVKSAMNHFHRREAIRQTYGQKDIIPGKIVKLLFFLGTGKSMETQTKIDSEIEVFKDIIQTDFQDNYYNNTIKTMTTFRWLYKHCSSADFYLFTDDDMYISIENLFRYLQSGKKKMDVVETEPEIDRDKDVYIGMLFKTSPLRFSWSKWQITLNEYRWNKWPPYISAGAYVLSNKTMKELYIGSLFVKHFRFDDIFLAIVAMKLNIKLTHCTQFHFVKVPYDKERYRGVIASHGFDDPDELIRTWRDVHTN